MKRFLINGPNKGVKGEIKVSGAKNSCLPLMAASILFKKKVIRRGANDNTFRLRKYIKRYKSRA